VGDGRIEVAPNEPRQVVTVMGGDMERSSMALLDAAKPRQVAEWAFGDIRFNICRVHYDKHQELAEGEPDFAFYDRQVAAMRLVREANPRIVFQHGGHPRVATTIAHAPAGIL
jgi:hypothetical protein